MKNLALLLVALFFAFTFECEARTYSRLIKISSGTGFFVSDDGYLITNHHVVEPCGRKINVENDSVKTTAEIVEIQKGYDLALLKINGNSPAYANFRPTNDDPEQKESIFAVGYPNGDELTTWEGVLEDMRGPRNEEHFLQFSNMIQKGNSGGPLLDSSARVIGVVRAKSQSFVFNESKARKEVVRETDIAISRKPLLAIMFRNQIRPKYNIGETSLSASSAEDIARDFVVKITCEITGRNN